MDRDIMLRWINHFLEQATNKELNYLLYFIKGYISKK